MKKKQKYIQIPEELLDRINSVLSICELMTRVLGLNLTNKSVKRLIRDIKSSQIILKTNLK